MSQQPTIILYLYIHFPIRTIHPNFSLVCHQSQRQRHKNKSIGDKHNYRPIGLSNTFTKIFEYVLMNCMETLLSTTCDQFGFNAKHGTYMCVYALKELIRYYVRHGSQMHVAFLDAFRAFDRLNHVILLSKLVKCGVPLYIVGIVAFWYSSQLYFVWWGTSLSVGFTVSNGVHSGRYSLTIVV